MYSMKEENLKIVYQEINELQRQQQGSIDLLYNKLNWILVSDVVFLAALYSVRHPALLVVLLVSVSAILALIGFQPQTFHITAKISEQLDKTGETDFMKLLLEKKRDMFNINIKKTKLMKNMLAWSRYLLIAALGLQFLVLLVSYAK